jgi:hypothetical protein
MLLLSQAIMNASGGKEITASQVARMWKLRNLLKANFSWNCNIVPYRTFCSKNAFDAPWIA